MKKILYIAIAIYFILLFIYALKELIIYTLKKIKTNVYIKKNAKCGIRHNNEIINILNNTKKPYKLINDLMIKYNNLYIQIDHILINENGIYVFEDKTYEGFIFGNNKNNFWYNILGDRKNYFFNPVLQNSLHCNILNKLLIHEKKNSIFNVVIFTQDVRIVNKNKHCYTLNTFSQALNSTTKVLTIDEINNIYNQITNLNIKSSRVRKKHFKNIYNLRHDGENKNFLFNLYDFDNYMFINNWGTKKVVHKKMWLNKDLTDFEIVKFNEFHHIPNKKD